MHQSLHLFLFLLLKIKFLLQISLFYLLAVLLVHIVNFFEPKLSNVARNSNLTIFYINSENSEELEDIQALRKRYGIATVQSYLFSENGTA